MLQNDEHRDPANQGSGHEDPPPEEAKPEGDDKSKVSNPNSHFLPFPSPDA